MDVDHMSGSTLEAMAMAVEGSAVVLICVSKKYKESQACRTEAEYAFQQRKKIIPVVMESGFKPTGWLGALMGTRLYFDMSDARRIPAKMPHLMKELADSGKIFKATSSLDLDERVAEDVKPSSRMGSDNPDNWSSLEVEDWLKKIRCADFCDSFRSKDMDGMALCGMLRMSSDSRLMHEVLEREFGMKVLGQRLRLIEELHRLYA
ncbi:hypothetical protein CEUSTIGMA_g3747.t1 [Chlamydomonas eustigma]|uniref:SAM domain-containing protein n=1 Tax=Chlamydomonas eustigma TaxID=1157962 RepID=A0A250X087_9CHLO|nr:hypothetical protein CEUSTIGMA_g3747.t1 [Chlamydomonas eustigma]|eukprot:GAX76302.1 hypothetical protein CEUSTIGMA_g3747.t1 [Chlamydomonas eustigma]